jgi:hypothetical protein
MGPVSNNVFMRLTMTDDVDWVKRWVDEVLAEDAQTENQKVRLT